jgi:hypothetical protein
MEVWHPAAIQTSTLVAIILMLLMLIMAFWFLLQLRTCRNGVHGPVFRTEKNPKPMPPETFDPINTLHLNICDGCGVF